MVMPLSAPQPSFKFRSLDEIPDTQEDKPVAGIPFEQVGPLKLPELFMGGASFSNQYNSDEMLMSDMPLRVVRLALRYGINAFDTSAYYGPSEIILGAAFKALSPQYPRSSYKISTKCGRYGPTKEDFDYSPSTLRKSIERSLARLGTDYLDIVYLHDVEFVAEAVMPRTTGHHSEALGVDAAAYGLEEGQEGKVWGPGDQKVLDAIAELRKMQSEGLIRHVGISGYPLPTLLRLAFLISHTAPHKPLDVLLSYSHSNLQNASFWEFVPALMKRAEIKQLVVGSPLNMGLLTKTTTKWHPAPEGLRQVTARAREICQDWKGGLTDVALGFSLRRNGRGNVVDTATFGGFSSHSNTNGNTNTNNGGVDSDIDTREIPTVIGPSTLRELHENVRLWRVIREESQELDLNLDLEREEKEREVMYVFRQAGYLGWSWASP